VWKHLAVKPPPEPIEAAPRHDPGAGGDNPELRRLEEHVTDLRAHVHRLETELDARQREISELHTLLGMAQRALPVPQAPAAAPGGTGAGAPDMVESADHAASPLADGEPAYPQPAEAPPGAPPQLTWWQRIWRLGTSA
jgi:hypothetical protein